MRSIENDLIDEYVRGELTSEERAKFEELFLASPIRRQRVDFAKSLAGVSAKQSATSAITKETSAFWNIFRAMGQRPRVLVYGVAVLLVAVIIGSLWLFIRRSPRTEPVTARQQTQNTVPGPTPDTKPTPGNAIENPSLPSKGERARDSAPPLKSPTQESNIATFVLLPGLSRSEGERTKLVVPAGRTSISLKLVLTEPDAKSHRYFTAELSGASGKVWSSNVLSMRKDGSVILSFPVSLLKLNTAKYDLTLRGRAGRTEPFETLGYYYLTMARE